MSHERVFYSCGCLQMQCRCHGPHVTRKLTYPCPKHAAGTWHVGSYVWANGSVTEYAGYNPDWRAWLCALEVETDRERLLPEVWD